jgi:hypothetical protein
MEPPRLCIVILPGPIAGVRCDRGWAGSMGAGEETPASPFGDRLKEEALRRSFALWCRLWRAAGSTPSWNRFEPALLADMLTQLEIHERTPGGRFLSRQAWSPGADRIARGAGRLHFDERVGPRLYEVRRRVFDACLDRGLPIAYRDFIVSPDAGPRMFRRLLLPFRDDSEKPNLLLSHVIALAVPPGATPDPRSQEVLLCSVADLAA